LHRRNNQILARDLVALLQKTNKQLKNLLLVLDSTPVSLLRHLRPANPVEIARDRPGHRRSTLRDGRRRKGRGSTRSARWRVCA
jgi:hypothetical protein